MRPTGGDTNKMAKSFEEALASSKFVVASSVDPPKGTGLEGLRQLVQRLKDVVDAVGISDNHKWFHICSIKK